MVRPVSRRTKGRCASRGLHLYSRFYGCAQGAPRALAISAQIASAGIPGRAPLGAAPFLEQLPAAAKLDWAGCERRVCSSIGLYGP
jgi:hypothetical protein